ncbi:MAG: DUF1328 domain-containing protein [Burkholderiales bacterium]|nr:DUF1328 domain-containing protein [Burkholderiales bacterium]MDR4518675.1 DUF1328 domain-containing protein [Nitrosomonas sp.]
MFNWAVVFFIIAIVAGALGFGSIAGTAVELAKIAFFVGLLLALVFWLSGRRGPPR